MRRDDGDGPGTWRASIFVTFRGGVRCRRRSFRAQHGRSRMSVNADPDGTLALDVSAPHPRTPSFSVEPLARTFVDRGATSVTEAHVPGRCAAHEDNKKGKGGSLIQPPRDETTRIERPHEPANPRHARENRDMRCIAPLASRLLQRLVVLDVPPVLRHRDDKGTEDKNAEDRSVLAAAVLCLLLRLKARLGIVILEGGSVGPVAERERERSGATLVSLQPAARRSAPLSQRTFWADFSTVYSL